MMMIKCCKVLQTKVKDKVVFNSWCTFVNELYYSYTLISFTPPFTLSFDGKKGKREGEGEFLSLPFSIKRRCEGRSRM